MAKVTQRTNNKASNSNNFKALTTCNLRRPADLIQDEIFPLFPAKSLMVLYDQFVGRDADMKSICLCPALQKSSSQRNEITNIAQQQHAYMYT